MGLGTSRSVAVVADRVAENMATQLAWLLTFVLLVALVASGCESGGADGQESAVGGGEDPSVSTTVGSVGFAETLIEWHWTVENETARCMAERGFEYVVYVPQPVIDGIRAMYGDNRIEVKPDGDDYWAPLLPMESSPGSVYQEEELLAMAHRTGFNIFFEPESLRPPLADDANDNPNAATVAALGSEEAAEYHRALQGYAAGDLDSANQPTEEQLENSCSQIARRTAGPEPLPPTQLDAVDIEKLNILGDKVYRLVNADPRLDAAEADRVACLAHQGLPPDPYGYILDLLHAELERVTGDPHGAIEGQGTEAGMAEAFGVEPLRELQDEELVAAIAGNECATARTQVERELITEYEQQILDENPDIAALLNQSQ